MEQQKEEEIEAIEQQKEEIKAIEQLLNSSSTDDIVFEGFMPDDLLSVESNLRFVSSFSQIEFESLERSLSQIPCTSVESKLLRFESLESSSSQIEFERSQIPWPTDFSDPDHSLPRILLPSRPLHPNHHGCYDLPFDYECEICGANHWTDTCSYIREISLDDAKLINDSEFDIVCFNCWKVIDNGACPVRCSPARFKVTRKAVFHLPGYAPTDLLSKDPLTAQQVPTSFSRKQKEASASTETPNTIEDLSAPPGSNSSSQERKTHPLAFYDLEANMNIKETTTIDFGVEKKQRIRRNNGYFENRLFEEELRLAQLQELPNDYDVDLTSKVVSCIKSSKKVDGLASKKNVVRKVSKERLIGWTCMACTNILLVCLVVLLYFIYVDGFISYRLT